MSRSTRCEQVKVPFYASDLQAHFECYRSVFINSLLILWAFQLTLDPTAPLDDMGFMNGDEQRPCTIEFKTRMLETELSHMMREDPVENMDI